MTTGKARLTVAGLAALAFELTTMIILVASRAISAAGLPLRPLVTVKTFVLTVLAP